MNNKVQEPETVAGHMYRMAMISFLFTGGGGTTHSGSEVREDARPSSDTSGSGISTCTAAKPVDRER